MILPDGITAIEVVRQRQVVYTAHCHIGLRGAAMLSIEEIINEEMENGGAPEAAEENNTEGGEE